MMQSVGKLIPNEALIYERADGIVYARYRDPPHNSLPRWVVGGDPVAVAREQGELINYIEWQQLCELALNCPTLKKQLDKLIQTYYIIKDGRETSD